MYMYIYWKRSWRVHIECEVSSASKRNFARRNKTALGPGDRLRPLSKFLNKLKIVENILPKNEKK